MTFQLSMQNVVQFTREKKERVRTDKALASKLNSLKDSINLTNSEINSAIDNFNNVTEPCLIDYYIYKIQSEQSKFSQLLSEYKALESAINLAQASL